MVKIKKVLNSNVVLVEDEKNSEFILLGKGIGYGKKMGNRIKIDQSHQLFIPINDSKTKSVLEMIESIPSTVLEIAQRIVLEAKNKIQTNFNDSIYFVLADHINFAIERYRKGMLVTSSLTWEIQSLYPIEYEIACEGVRELNEKLNLNLPEEEAVSIVFHLVNAQMVSNSRYDTGRYVKLIGDIINIIKNCAKKEFYKESIHYIRFISHIRHFAERFFMDEMIEENEDNIYIINEEAYTRERKIIQIISKDLYNKYGKVLPKDEEFFLMIYINLILKK